MKLHVTSRFSVLMTVLVLFAFSTAGKAQDATEEILLEEQAESSETSELIEQLRQFREHPLNLNTATLQDILQLPDMTNRIGKAILTRRTETGTFKKTDDLLQIDGIDANIFERIKPYITIRSANIRNRNQVAISVRNRVNDFIDTRAGFQNGTYHNSPKKIYNRVLIQLQPKIKTGLLTEKDSGENNLTDLRLFFTDFRVTKNARLIVGDYQFEAGQGLVLWSPYGFSKSSDTIFPIKKHARNIQGYTSTNENAFFRGAAMSLKSRLATVTTFFSRVKLDATPISNSGISGFSTTGYHRNETELLKKDRLTETAAGGRIELHWMPNLRLGTTFYQSNFDKNIEPPDLTRKHFAFRGKKNVVYGTDLQLSFDAAEIFLEAARSKNSGKALLLGSILDYKTLKLALLYRNYGKNFQNFHGFGFAERNGTTQNEKGYYIGLYYKPRQKITVHAYYDIFSQPWRTFSQSFPTNGNDFLAQIKYSFKKNIRFTFRFRRKLKQEIQNILNPFGRHIQEFAFSEQNQFRLQFDFLPYKKISFRNRVEYNTVSLNNFDQSRTSHSENGFLIYQEIRIKLGNKFRISARWTMFETESFRSRVFQYESDLPGILTNRALFGRGSRWYVLLNYRPFYFIKIAFKYSEIYRDDVKVIGTGPDQIANNLDRRIGLQLDWHL